MGRGRKMKSPAIAPIVSSAVWGAVHELERAPLDALAESYALVQVLICASDRTQGAEVSAGRRACVSSRRTSGGTRMMAGM